MAADWSAGLPEDLLIEISDRAPSWRALSVSEQFADHGARPPGDLADRKHNEKGRTSSVAPAHRRGGGFVLRHAPILIYHNQVLYALDFRGYIVRCDIHGQKPTQQLHIVSDPPLEFQFVVTRRYLLEFSGKFLVVLKDLDFVEDLDKDEDEDEVEELFKEGYYKTVGFKVVEVKVEEGGTCSWKEVKELGNKAAVFLGYNSSFWVECYDFNNCEPNCLYFSEDEFDYYGHLEKGGGKDMGIYHLPTGTFKPVSVDHELVVCSKVTPPTWIELSY